MVILGRSHDKSINGRYDLVLGNDLLVLQEYFK